MGPNDFFVTADVKDFFMSGSFDTLAGVAHRYAPQDLATPARDTARWLLDNQFVTDSTGQLYKCLAGAGMGNNFSGELANLGFHHQMEVPLFASELMEAVRMYARVHDDIFMILKPSVHRRSFMSSWAAMAPSSDFKIDKWEASLVRADFLDLTIYRQEGSHVGFRPFFKPSALAVPLLPGSAHLRSAVNWPLQDDWRLAANSSSFANYVAAKRQFMCRLETFGAPPSLLQSLKHQNAYHDGRVKRQKQQNSNIIYCKVPAHPVWVKLGLQSQLDSVMSSTFMTACWKHFVQEYNFETGNSYEVVMPKLRIAWKLPGAHLHIKLRKGGRRGTRW